MRLKTKFQDENFDLGEVIDASIMYGYEDKIEVYCTEKMKHRKYNSIKDFTDHWEDAPEEPKNPCFINWFGEVSELLGHISDREIEKLKEAGNYFETKEEAEKAVEKLKAWKRVKDKGLKAFSSEICGDDFVVNFKLTNHIGYSQSIDDFDCIFDFGGEE